MFDDRRDAGRQLAEKLRRYQGADAIVLALPRGGVEVGYEVARALKLPLDIVVVRKIGHPAHPEYAIGAVDEASRTLMNEREAETLDPAWLAEETARQCKEAQRRLAAYRGTRPALELEGKTALLVDDGIATGLTMRLAVRTTRALHARRVIVALPVAPEGASEMLKREGADEVVILLPPEHFLGAVGAHYVDFRQLDDSVVKKLLHETPRI